jgi:hypothetical protein
LTVYFPNWFTESDLNYLERLKKYLQARIEYELTGDVELIAEITKHADYFIEVNKPKDFNPFVENCLIQMENEFESMAAALGENGVTNASGLTVFEFYSRIRYFEKKANKNS